MFTKLPRIECFSAILFPISLTYVSGCISLESLPAQAPVRDEVESATNRPYLLYVPSRYSERRAWPLLVVCHGTWPYDTADLQMREWARFGENEGIIIAAPSLQGAKGDLPPAPEKQIELQRQDERLILGVVSAIRNRYHVADEKIFLTGWSAGAYSILYTGLGNPSVFRALAIRQGSFDPRFMDVPSERFDRWQPIKVLYGRTDIVQDQTKACIAWLREQKLYVEAEEITGAHRRIDPAIVWRFFGKVMKERPWIQIRARSAGRDDPLSIAFEIKAIPPATRLRWRFGDEDESREESPMHRYAKPGRYEVSVDATLKGGTKYTRRTILHVGDGS